MEANFVLFKVVKIKYRLDIEPCFDRLIFTQLGPNKMLLFFVSARLGSARLFVDYLFLTSPNL